MIKSKRKPPLKNRYSLPRLLATLAGLALLVVAVIVIARRFDKSPSLSTNNPNNSAQSAPVNYSPPTEQEKADSEAVKTGGDPKPNPSTPPDNTSGKKAVTPIIVSASKDGANAYVPGIFEDGGSCTALFSKDDNHIQASSDGFQNYSYTSCAPIKLNGSLNIKGTWSVVVSYSSPTAAGSSQPYAFEVQ